MLVHLAFSIGISMDTAPESFLALFLLFSTLVQELDMLVHHILIALLSHVVTLSIIESLSFHEQLGYGILYLHQCSQVTTTLLSSRGILIAFLNHSCPRFHFTSHPLLSWPLLLSNLGDISGQNCPCLHELPNNNNNNHGV